MARFPYRNPMPWGIQVFGYGGAPAWTPAEFGADLEAWYPNSFLASVGDGNPIAQWDDASGNDRHVAQATGASQPVATLEGGVFHALGDGVDDHLIAVAWDTIVQPYTICAVLRRGAVGIERVAFGSTGNNPRFYVSGAGAYTIRGSANVTGAAAPDAFAVVVGSLNGASSYIRVDGVESTGDVGAAGLGTAQMFARSTAPTSFFNGSIRELFVVSAVPSAGQLAALETYLAAIAA